MMVTGSASALLLTIVLSGADLRIIDGDSIALPSGSSMRLEGIDAPERSGACLPERMLGGMARGALLRWAGEASQVVITVPMRNGPLGLEPVGDKFGRPLVRLYLDGRDAGERMVTSGLARAYSGGARQGWCG